MSFWEKIKQIATDPKTIQVLGIAAHVIVAVSVKNPAALAKANAILNEVDQISGGSFEVTPQTEKAG